VDSHATNPNAANVAVALESTANLVINEWLANAAPGGDDWVELTTRPRPVPLRGIYLGTSNTTFQLSALSFIAAGGACNCSRMRTRAPIISISDCRRKAAPLFFTMRLVVNSIA
jgi:hypothetical protein